LRFIRLKSHEPMAPSVVIDAFGKVHAPAVAVVP
jgi:hypothetical protein